MQKVAVGGSGLVFAGSSQVFRPLGFNYDRDHRFRLLEEFWDAEWATVVAALERMRGFGANVVRIHLQLCEFMRDPDTACPENLARLAALARESERIGVYLDITGLGSYRNSDPAWYENAVEADRWRIQARFWAAVAQALAGSPAVCWFNLMNEPTAPRAPVSGYVVPFIAGGLFYVQALTKDLDGRSAVQVGAEWIAQMTAAIKAVDPYTLITVGMPGSLGVPAEAVQQMLTQIPPRLLPLLGQWRGGPQPVVASERPNTELDLYCLHSYPQTGAADQAIDEIRTWAAHGKPLVVEETFPLHCTIPEWLTYAHAADPDTAGWLSFYWGPPADPNQNAATELIHNLTAGTR